jgi:alpha-tubulin suppressor-like RCC1 family protein
MNVWTFGNNQYGQLGLAIFECRNKAKQVSAGGDHTIIIDLNDNVWAFGLNNFGQSRVSSAPLGACEARALTGRSY